MTRTHARAELKGLGLHTLYVGCESGDDEVRPSSPGFQGSRVSRGSRPESEGQNLALTVLCVPSWLDSGLVWLVVGLLDATLD